MGDMSKVQSTIEKSFERENPEDVKAREKVLNERAA
jgi:hypothetical protein